MYANRRFGAQTPRVRVQLGRYFISLETQLLYEDDGSNVGGLSRTGTDFLNFVTRRAVQLVDYCVMATESARALTVTMQ